MEQLSFEPIWPKENTVGAQILGLLTDFPDGLCREDFALNHIYEVSARIGELQKMGWLISNRKCQRHKHRGNIVEYFLA